MCAVDGPEDKAAALFNEERGNRFHALVQQRLQPDSVLSGMRRKLTSNRTACGFGRHLGSSASPRPRQLSGTPLQVWSSATPAMNTPSPGSRSMSRGSGERWPRSSNYSAGLATLTSLCWSIQSMRVSRNRASIGLEPTRAGGRRLPDQLTMRLPAWSVSWSAVLGASAGSRRARRAPLPPLAGAELVGVGDEAKHHECSVVGELARHRAFVGRDDVAVFLAPPGCRATV
jgi:hypothetical protein